MIAIYIVGWLVCGLIAYGFTLPLLETEFKDWGAPESLKVLARFMLCDCLLLGVIALAFVSLGIFTNRQKYSGFRLF